VGFAAGVAVAVAPQAVRRPTAPTTIDCLRNERRDSRDSARPSASGARGVPGGASSMPRSGMAQILLTAVRVSWRRWGGLGHDAGDAARIIWRRPWLVNDELAAWPLAGLPVVGLSASLGRRPALGGSSGGRMGRR